MTSLKKPHSFVPISSGDFPSPLEFERKTDNSRGDRKSNVINLGYKMLENALNSSEIQEATLSCNLKTDTFGRQL